MNDSLLYFESSILFIILKMLDGQSSLCPFSEIRIVLYSVSLFHVPNLISMYISLLLNLGLQSIYDIMNFTVTFYLILLLGNLFNRWIND